MPSSAEMDAYNVENMDFIATPRIHDSEGSDGTRLPLFDQPEAFTRIGLILIAQNATI